MAIRTAYLGDGSRAGAGTSVIYTALTAQHVRVRECAIGVGAGVTAALQAVHGVGAARTLLVVTGGLAAVQTLNELSTVLEAGDKLQVTTTGLGTTTWYASGTIYDN